MIFNESNVEITQIETNEDLVIKVVVYTPDKRIPGIALGIVRKDIPIYGTISDKYKTNPKKISENYYEYTIKYNNFKLLPADYIIKAHAMDPECIRIMDEVKTKLRVYSNTSDMGVVQLETKWV